MTAVDPTLGRIPRVLVPIQVDALVLREARAGFADCRMADPDPGGGRQDLLPPPFADRAEPRPAGVHLHWAVPDALTRTRPTAPPAPDGTAPVAALPAIPDRWLVVRLALGATPDHRGLAAWVLETSGAVPVVRALADWHESGVGPAPGREPTAVGPGDLAWAAYYDNVVGRLGFHDPLDDGALGPLAYLVCGWYGEPRLDPLADPAITSLSGFYGRLAELGWSLPGGELEQDVLATPFPATSGAGAPAPGALAELATLAGRPPLVTDGSWWPQGLLAHGAVVGLGWPDPGWPDAEAGLLGAGQGGPPDPADTRVALGATMSDALGALMVGFLAAAQGVPEDEVLSEDRMLEAFQIGLLSEIDHPDGRARLDARLHADGFRAIAGGQRSTPAGDPAETGTVERSQPRWFGPGEPAVVVQGLRRSQKHGGDGRFSQDGTLVCRLSSFTVTGLSAQLGDGTQRATVEADALLEVPFGHPDLPPDCADLVRETVLLDPGSARAAALATLPPLADGDTAAVDQLTRNFMVEQTVWWALRDPLINPDVLLVRSGIAGSLPSPLAVTPPTVAWAPRHLDWEAEVFPTGTGLAGWRLGDLDYAPGHPDAVDGAPGTGTVVRGRALLTGGVAQRAAQAGQAAIELVTAGTGVLGDASDVFVPASVGDLADPGAGAGTQTLAQALVAALRNMDMMAATLDGVHARLRGEPTGQWVGASPPPAPPPDPTAPGLIAGALRPVRLRLVDTFGQVVDLLGSGPGQPAGPALTSRPVSVTGRPGLVALPPRFAAPARLLFRFVDARPGPHPPALEDTDESARPVCGYLLPDHLDGALELFDAEGAALGQLLPALDGTGRAVWERAPGLATGAGDAPSATVADPTMGAIADGLVRWGDHDGGPGQEGNEGALAALLRLVDSTLWSTDPFGHAGDEHAALLTGHPIVVLRAMLRLDVDDPLGPADIPTTPVPVRLGALAHWQDGLLAFFAGDDLAHAHPAGPAAAALAREVGPGRGYLGPAAQVAEFHQAFTADLAPGEVPASPVTHPYVADDATVAVWPGQAMPVTLLVVPHAVAHATSGLLPRKELGVRRQWVAAGLARIAPTFRFGPVLVDPAAIRMPVATDLAGTWTWNHRRDVSTWADDPVVPATGDALMTTGVAAAEEGWLTLRPLPGGGTVVSALDQLIQLVPFAAKKALATREFNVALHPAVPATVHRGTLTHKDAGPPGGGPLPVRVVAVLGPGATFQGLAATLLQEVYAKAGEPLDRDDLAKGLVFYNRDFLSASAGDWLHHKVGVCLPLPIEIEASGAWTVNADEVRGWAASFRTDWRRRLSVPPTPLAVPEPAEVEDEARRVVVAGGTMAVRAAGLWERVLRNPSEAVLTFIDVFRRFDAAGAAVTQEFALATVGGAEAHQVALLAAFTAGNGILRRLAEALKPPPPPGAVPAKLAAARTLVDNALFQGPAGARTLRPHREVPETVDLLAAQSGLAKVVPGAKADPPGGLHRVVLGRDVAVGRSDPARVGGVTPVPAFGGRLLLDPYLAEDAKGLRADDPARAGPLALLALDGAGGGPLDAVRAGDPGLLSVGLGAWTALDRAGLAALLFKFKEDAAAEFDLFFGLHGLHVDQDPADATKFRLRQLGADGKPSTVMDDATLRTFLGGTPDATGNLTFTDWATRVRLPALVSRRYRRAQVELAIDKVMRTANPVELAVASVSPFPAPYTLAVDSAKSTALQTVVTADMGPFVAGLAADLPSRASLSAALIDLTAGAGPTAYASSHAPDDEDTFNIGSMGKMLAMYAAFELRFRLRKALKAAEAKGLDVTVANWQVRFIKIVQRTWSGRVAKGFPGFDTRMPARFPKLGDMFTFTTVPAPPPPGRRTGRIDFKHGTATDADIIGLDTGDPDLSKMKFLELIKSMIFMSNAVAAGLVIDAVGYPYLNGVLRDGGFFEPKSKKGLWVSGNYQNRDWRKPVRPGVDAMDLSARGTAHYKSTTDFVGNAKQVARLLALTDRGELFDGADAAACAEMRLIMRRHAIPGLPDPDVSFIRKAIAPPLGPHVVDEAYSKIGIGVRVPPSELKGEHDGAIIARVEGATSLRYVAAVIGGYTSGATGDVAAYRQLARLLDGAIAKVHP